MAHFSLLSPSSVRGTLEILAHTVDILNNLHTVPYTPVHTLRHLLFEEVTLENMLVLRAFSFSEWKENSGRTNAELPRLIRKSHRQTPSKSQEGTSSRFTPSAAELSLVDKLRRGRLHINCFSVAQPLSQRESFGQVPCNLREARKGNPLT